MTNRPSYEELISGFQLVARRAGTGLSAGRAAQYRLDVQRPHLPPGPGEQARRSSGKTITETRSGSPSTTCAFFPTPSPQFLVELGIKPGERVCLFLDRVPELYIGFLGILKMGAVAQPLFSAFGDESLFVRLADARTSAIITQKKHVHKVRKIRDELPELRHIIVVDAGESPLQEREIAFQMEQAAPSRGFCRLSDDGRVAIRSALHLRHDRPAQGRAARPLLDRLAVPHRQMGARSAAATTFTGATPIRAG